MMKKVNILIIGGGSAGMAAAAAAYEQGERDILILERSDRLGGILCQCIHNGLYTFHNHFLDGLGWIELGILWQIAY